MNQRRDKHAPASPLPAADEWLAFAALGLFTLVLFLFTGKTLSLDEIKLPVLLTGGPALLLSVIALNFSSLRSRVGVSLLWWLSALSLAGLLSLLFAEHRWVGAITLFQFFSAVAIFLALGWTLHRPSTLKLAIRVYLIIGALEIFATYFHWLGGLRWIRDVIYPEIPTKISSTYQLLYTLGGSDSFFGTVLNEDFLSGFLVTLIPVAAAGIFWFRDLATRLLCYAIVLTGSTGIIITFSKETLGGLILAGFILVALLALAAIEEKGTSLSLDKRTLTIVAGFAGALMVMIAIIAWLLLRDRFAREIATLGGAFKSRSVIYEGALGIFTSHPIFGGGPGAFRILFAEFRPDDYFLHEISNVTYYAHNLYLDFLSETGLAGFIPFMGLHVALVLLGWRAYKTAAKGNENGDGWRASAIHAGFLAAIVGLAVQNGFSPATRWAVGSAFMATLWGLAVAAFRIEIIASKNLEGAEEAPVKAPLIPEKPLYLGLCTLAALLFISSSFYSLRHWRGAVSHGSGMTHLETQNFAEAIPYFEETIRQNPSYVTTYYKLGNAVHSNAARTANNFEDLAAAAQRCSDVYGALESYWPRYAEVDFNRALINRLIYQQGLRYISLRPMTKPEEEEDRQEKLVEVANLMEHALAAARRYNKQSIKASASQILADILADRANFIEDFPGLLNEEASPEELRRTALDLFGEAEAAWEMQENLPRLRVDEAAKRRLLRRRLATYLALEEYEGAFATAERLYRLDPTDTARGLQLVELQLDTLKQPDKALEVAESIVADYPMDLERRIELVRVLVNTGGGERAAPLAKEARNLLDVSPWNDDPKARGTFISVLKSYEDYLENEDTNTSN